MGSCVTVSHLNASLVVKEKLQDNVHTSQFLKRKDGGSRLKLTFINFARDQSLPCLFVFIYITLFLLSFVIFLC